MIFSFYEREEVIRCATPDEAWSDKNQQITPITGTNDLATNVLQPGATSSMALIAETLLTMFFVLIILGATDEKVGFGKFAGLAIGVGLGLVNIEIGRAHV